MKDLDFSIKRPFPVILLRVLSVVAFCYFGFLFLELSTISANRNPIQEFSVISAERQRYGRGRGNSKGVFKIEYRNQLYEVRTRITTYNHYINGGKPTFHYSPRRGIVFSRRAIDRLRSAAFLSILVFAGTFAPTKKERKKEEAEAKKKYDKKYEIYKDLDFNV